VVIIHIEDPAGWLESTFGPAMTGWPPSNPRPCKNVGHTGSWSIHGGTAAGAAATMSAD
jgi:hypothetical protein